KQWWPEPPSPLFAVLNVPTPSPPVVCGTGANERPQLDFRRVAIGIVGRHQVLLSLANAPAHPRRAHALVKSTPHLPPAGGCSGWLGGALTICTETFRDHCNSNSRRSPTRRQRQPHSRKRFHPQPRWAHNANSLQDRPP